MPRLCTVCTHPQHAAIDAALVRHTQGYRAIASRYGLTKPSLQRHEIAHLRQTIQQSKELRDMLDASNLLEHIGKWHSRMERQYSKADAQDDVPAAANVARVGLTAIESFARIGAISELEKRLEALEGGKPNGEQSS